MDFDFETFKTDLYQECKTVFPKILTDLRDEDIYGITLYYSCAGWGYLFPSVFTHKGLAEISEIPSVYDKDKTLEQRRHSLKWSSCDSPRHMDYESHFKKTEKTMTRFQNYIEHLYDTQEKDNIDPLVMIDHYELAVEKIRYETLFTLKKIKNEGILGDQTDRITITLLSGDQSNEEKLENTKIINSEQLYLSFEDDLEKAYKAW